MHACLNAAFILGTDVPPLCPDSHLYPLCPCSYTSPASFTISFEEHGRAWWRLGLGSSLCSSPSLHNIGRHRAIIRRVVRWDSGPIRGQLSLDWMVDWRALLSPINIISFGDNVVRSHVLEGPRLHRRLWSVCLPVCERFRRDFRPTVHHIRSSG